MHLDLIKEEDKWLSKVEERTKRATNSSDAEELSEELDVWYLVILIVFEVTDDYIVTVSLIIIKTCRISCIMVAVFLEKHYLFTQIN